MDDHRYRLGATIRDGRLARDLTQEELGDLIGVTQVTVSGWESGKQIPKLPALGDLAKRLKLDAGKLYALAGEAAREPIPA